MRLRVLGLLFVFLVLGSTSYISAQQRGQYVPGQYGLNAGLGLQPDPGFTFLNMTINYSADSLKNANGNSVPITGIYGFWAVENMFFYASPANILGGRFVSMASLNTANASATADFAPVQFGINAAGEGMGDTWVQPVNLGWHFNRLDTWVGYAFVAPTGKYFPLASNNTGSGYWGNNFATGTTFYLTKTKGTQLNLATNWEFHGQKRDTNITPGQAFTDEWGLGQILPLKKDLSSLLQLGVVGYDQWQVSANKGLTSVLPYYSMHAIGFQSNFIAPPKALTLFFKYEPEYLAKATTRGRTIVFGLAWTVRSPQPTPAKQ
jgi:hypothetical protein